MAKTKSKNPLHDEAVSVGRGMADGWDISRWTRFRQGWTMITLPRKSDALRLARTIAKTAGLRFYENEKKLNTFFAKV